MDSSDTEAGVFDCSVGAIVWVRRRNGSWWPGKILGPEELSASHLMSPRSGTPVKLLGREDASVDWYNLEKSKRVKPFRCGEFEDCIERAEASQGIPPKKREKYARREDAILHALELEKQLLEKKFGKLGSPSNGKSKNLPDVGKEAATSPESWGHGNEKHFNPKSTQHSKGLDLSVEDKNKDLSQPAQRVKEGNQLSGDDDNSDVQPRMRVLQDLGRRGASSKRKMSFLVSSNGSHKHDLDDGVRMPLDSDLIIGNMGLVNSRNLLDKRKRSHEGQVEDPLGKRRDKRRPLVQVLESSEKLPVLHSSLLQSDEGSVSALVKVEEQTGVADHARSGKSEHMAGTSEDSFEYKDILLEQRDISTPKFEESNRTYPGSLGEDNTSGSTEDTETDSSETASLDTDTDDALTALSDGAAPIELMPKSLGRFEAQGGHGGMSNEEPADLAPPDDTCQPSPAEPVSPGVTMSKWQLKGKRNNRTLTKRYPNVVSDRNGSKGPTHVVSHEGEGSYCCDDSDSLEKSLRTYQSVGYRSRALDSSSRTITNWEDMSWNDQPAFGGCWEDPVEYCDPVFVGRRFGGRTKSLLVDVDLKVQSIYQREHVPMISLMSKLNGKAIVGHPIPIETLENGSSEFLLAAADDFHMETLDYDTNLQPVWRTARRTANSRVPRPPHSSSTLDGDETVEHLQYVDHGRKLFGKSNASYGHKASIMKKGPSSRKPPKKISLSASQKIRTLSSIGTQQRHSNDLKLHCGNSYQVDGLIKPESLPTAVACIPVKLVFSRLHEELVARHQ